MFKTYKPLQLLQYFPNKIKPQITSSKSYDETTQYMSYKNVTLTKFYIPMMSTISA